MKNIALLAVMAICTVGMCYPRFNRQDVSAIRELSGQHSATHTNLGDAQHYVQYVKVFRGQAELSSVPAPFCYRPLVPFVASWLPADTMTSLNAVNVLALVAAVAFLHFLLVYLGFSYLVRCIALGMYVFSFPVFYYGAIGYVDPVLIGFLAAGAYFILTGQHGLVLVTLALGVLVKESILILVPVMALYARQPGKGWRAAIAIAVSATILYLIVTLLLRFAVPSTPGHTWVPSVQSVIFNIGRLRTWASFGLSFGLPGLVSLAALATLSSGNSEDTRQFTALCAGLLAALALAIWAILTAYADGRFIWTASPFTVPIAAYYLQRRLCGTEMQAPVKGTQGEMGLQ